MSDWLDWVEGRIDESPPEDSTSDDCPNCGENRNERMEWDTTEGVLWCLSCGTPFAPGETRTAAIAAMPEGGEAK